MSEQSAEKVQRVTDETVVITATRKFNGVDCVQYEYLGDLDEPYRTQLLTYAEVANKAKAWDEFVKWMQHQDQEYIRLDYPEIMTELEGK